MEDRGRERGGGDVFCCPGGRRKSREEGGDQDVLMAGNVNMIDLT